MTTVVARVSLDMLRSRQARREEPYGAHVPEPIVTFGEGLDPVHQALLADSVGLALLVVLETLPPADRLGGSATLIRHSCGVTAGGAIRDIETRADCERLVREFYGRTLVDPIIGWIFVDVAKLDVEAHVPRIASFWETILLGSRSYAGGAFAPHAALNARVKLRAGHFERWLALWRATVDELFVGERAELAKAHALRVAQAFHGRLEAMSAAAVPQPAGGGLSVTWHAPPPPLGSGQTRG